jgi:putative heme-binding domain-containing protein
MSRFPLPLLAVLFTAIYSSVHAAALVETPNVVVSNPPPVQMLVPGFTVRELPVALRNLNNLVYAPDGRLFALGYDGNVYQLKDTDGDGLEDTATDFYKNERNEIPPSIGMAWGPGGLYIASRGRIIHLRDKGDGTSELQTVTGGWVPPTAAAGSNLDAIGIAVDPAGNIYFGLGCDAWNGAYRINKQTGLPDYNLYSERGTIIKLSPDWKRRDILSTGLRFPVSLALNASGDLFCSDQEGATWLPNGNPFDELLHIVPGRHYGFPPRHPRLLPGVIDEPSVFDYGPQHQSTCGVHFNEPVGGGSAIFGPSWWRGDAFVAGESRGKIWRTKLVKTAAGYVAKNDLIACLAMLTIDAVPTPQGDLLVACHSGAPDWGTGPKGQGKVFKISYTDRDAPQPVLAYAVSPTETRVVFNRPIDPSRWRMLSTESRVTMGAHVAAGDRFESFVPGYQVVKEQGRVQRYDVPVVSAVVAPNRQSIMLRTAPRREASNYAVKLPDGLNTGRPQDANRRELPQHAAIDLLTDLGGLEAEWRDASGELKWSGWLPHPDLTVARELTKLSGEHRRLFELMAGAGRLTLRGQLDLHLMLRPAIQPGAKLDFEYPVETVSVVFKSSGALQIKSGASARLEQRGENEVSVTSESREKVWLPIEISVATDGPAPATLEVSWRTAEDQRTRALPLRRVLLPWATPRMETPPVAAARVIPEIAGGDWQRGKQVFASQKVACAVCHQVRGEGGVIGPDLSNLVHRDYASVLKDIVEPNAAINPDRIAYSVTLKDRTFAGGMLVDENTEAITLADAAGAKRIIPKKDITAMSALPTSLMPEGLWQIPSSQEQKDLMAFLLTEPPSAGR